MIDIGQTVLTYRCPAEAPLLRLLQCSQAEANARVNAAVRRFFQNPAVLSRPMPTWYTTDIPIGTGAIMAFFRALCAQWLLAHDDVPVHMRAQAQALARGARADSYFRMLETCWRLVLTLCAEWGEPALPLGVGPAIGVVTAMAGSGYLLGSIRNVRSTIAFAHRFSRVPSPTEDERFQLFYDCVARQLGDPHPHAKLALPLERLRAIGAQIAAGTSTHAIQEWALLTLSYFSVFRRTNVCEIVGGNVQPFANGVRILLSKSKPDQHAHGHEVFIDPLPEEPQLCPVRAILRWRDLIGDVPELPFFRHLGRLGMPTEQPLADRTVARILKKYVAAMGLDPNLYATQSLRAGLITEAILRNVSLVALAQHTNHHTLTSLARYFRPALEQRVQIVRTIATTPLPAMSAMIARGAHA